MARRIICRWRWLKRIKKPRHSQTKAPAQSLAHRVCLGGSQRRRQNSNTQIRQTLVDLISEDAIAIVEDEAIGMAARQRFPELRQRPFRRRMGSDVLVELLAGPHLYDDADVESTEGGGDHHEEVAGHGPFGRIADEGPTTLLRVRRAHRSVAVLADPARESGMASSNFNSLAMRCSPQVGFSAAIS